MKNFTQIIKNDFKNYMRYSIIQTVLILSVLFALSMVFLPNVSPLILVYITVFILPVIVFSISIYIENEEKTLFPLADKKCCSLDVILAKICSALLVLLIPMVLYVLVMKTVLHMNFSVILFVLIYALASTMHIIIGMVLAVVSKSNKVLSISYIAYIIIFSVMPIFYQEGLISEVFQYVLIVSPAYLSGVLFEQVIIGYVHTSDLLIWLAVFMQVIYIFVFIFFVLKPFFQAYILFRIKQEEETVK